jgi:MarR family transcriptional regulator, negative regulator of the multidrug operon emrRAB
MHDFHCHSIDEKDKNLEKMKPLWREKIQELTGSADTRGVEISGMVRRLANMYDTFINMDINGAELTGPRLGILIRLYINEQIGRTEGLNPTILSHIQNVSKNTISSLTKGLEDQGLVIRENDATDRRVYRLKLTDAGRKLIVDNMPRHIEYMNKMSSDLDDQEQTQLVHLLGKLIQSVATHSNLKRPNTPSS